MGQPLVQANGAPPAEPTQRPAGPQINIRTVVISTLIVVGIGLAFIFVARFYTALFLFLVAIILGTVTRPLVDWLAARGVRPQIGLLLVYLALLLLLVALIAIVVPVVFGQANAVVTQLPELYRGFRESLIAGDNRLMQRFAAGLPPSIKLSPSVATPSQPGITALGPAMQVAGAAGRSVFLAVALLVLAYYWVVEGELVLRRMLLLVRPDARETFRTVWAEMEGKIGAYFRGQLILMGIVAAMTLAGYLAIGLPYALGLALIAGLCEAIPIVGPTIGAIPAVLVAVSLQPDKILWAVGVAAVVQMLENNLLVPRIMDQSVGVNPILTILGIAAFGALFGFAGAVLAIPLAAMVQIIVTRLVMRPAAPAEVGRSRASILRLAAHELVQDVRKSSRAETDSTMTDPGTERAEDMIESIATELDEVLSAAETDA